MAVQKTLLLYFCCLWSYSSTVAQTPPVILLAPEPQLVPFNLDAMVDFNCTVRAVELIWQVNTAQLVDDDDRMDARNIGIFPEDMDNGDGTRSGVLRINVSESNQVNMTRISCIAVGSSTLTRNVSDPVNLTTFDIPEPPRNFQLTSSSLPGTLTIRWDPPTNTPPDVETTHDVEVVNLNTGDNYPSFPRPGLTLDTTELTFDEQNTSCTPFVFRVTATNDAGTSGPSTMTETIPISPDVTPINDDLRAQNGISVSFSGSEVSITLTFRRADTCDITSFPVVEHIVNIVSVTSFSITDADPVITVTLDMTVPLMTNSLYTISVTAATRITRRTSDAFQVYTTDVQTARVEYVESDNRVFLTCTFATGSIARGCIFIFTLRNESERFYVTQEALEGFQCNTTVNSAESYDTIEVVDWESDGSEGTLRRIIQPRPEDEAVFSDTCPLPDDSSLSGGQIAGIVIGFVCLLILAVVFLLVGLHFFTKYQHKRRAHKKLNGKVDARDTADGDRQTVAADGDTPRAINIGKVDLSNLENIEVLLNPHKVRKFKRMHSRGSDSTDMKNLLLYCE